MTLVALTGGSYQAKSLIANAQRCLNLYPEINPKDSPVPITHYPTPGTKFLVKDITGTWRCLYQASNNSIYGVVNQNVYKITGNLSVGFTLNLIGKLLTPASTTVYLADNGIVAILVDGTANGYAIDLATNEFAKITDPNFMGADRVDYLDTFFILNRPGTAEYYISLSEVSFLMLTSIPGTVLSGNISGPGTTYTDGTYLNQPMTGGSGTGFTANITVVGGAITDVTIVSPGQDYLIGDLTSSVLVAGDGLFGFTIDTIGGGAFDPLDFAAKAGYPDEIVTLIVMHLEIWLIGSQTSEVWYNAGAADFPFQILPGVFIEHGCAAKYSIAKQDLNIYWLSKDRQGQCIVLKGNNYAATRISTYAIEQEFSKYSTIQDAIGFCYQQEGHTFFVLTFPTANKTWVWDESTQLWHQRATVDADNNGILNRIDANCTCFTGDGVNLIGDFENGSLYQLSADIYTDNGLPIPRIRSFPHLLNNQNRVIYTSFVADMECGTLSNDGELNNNPPVVNLRWSDDRGRTFSNPVAQSLGAQGEYLTNMQWNRLGMARDRVFELSWSAPARTALNAAWVDATPAET